MSIKFQHYLDMKCAMKNLILTLNKFIFNYIIFIKKGNSLFLENLSVSNVYMLAS